MYYILYEGLKIESNEPVYCTVYTVHIYTINKFVLVFLHIYVGIFLLLLTLIRIISVYVQCTQYTVYSVHWRQ